MLQACNYVVVGNLLSTKELLDARVHPYITKFSYFQLKTEIFLWGISHGWWIQLSYSAYLFIKIVMKGTIDSVDKELLWFCNL